MNMISIYQSTASTNKVYKNNLFGEAYEVSRTADRQ